MRTSTASRIVEIFQNIDPNFTANHLAVFLRVASRGAATVNELADYTGMSRPAVNRVANSLANHKRNGETGFNLLDVERDPENTKANLYVLSARGRRIKAQIESLEGPMGSQCHATQSLPKESSETLRASDQTRRNSSL